MRINRLTLVAGLGAVLVLTLSIPANAMPNYARQQNGGSCFSCHALPANADTDLVESLSGETLGTTTLSFAMDLDKKTRAGLSIHTSDGGQGLFRYKTEQATMPDEVERTPDSRIDVTGMTGFWGGESFNARLSLLQNSALRSDLRSEQQQDTLLRYRVAYTPRVGDTALSIGFFGESQSTKSGSIFQSATNPIDRLGSVDSYGLDAAVNSRIGDVTLDIQAMYQNNSDATTPFVGADGSLVEVAERFAAVASIALEQTFGLSAGYRTYNGRGETGDTQEVITSIGVWLSINDDLKVESQYTNFGDGQNFLTDESAFTLLFLSSF